ncbi:hypothetical protein [Tetragenococcus halophilus]|uniref:HTH merR-type domain-containing protein n=1 Tax=Tetragenococcus halophilus TaxID=51669 RepID=A0AB35HR04_TETHA|nr:hypothetical protein [Tetragenococcus halophilus]MCO8298666.1 hypothetical protein [Tetragenococcus halophilus]
MLTELERLERLAYLKDEDNRYYDEWEKLKDKLFNDEETIKYTARCIPILVQFRSGESKTYESKADVVKALGINFRTLREYLDTDKPVKGGKSKAQGCYFYSLAKEDK